MSFADEQDRDKGSSSSPMITPVVAAVAAIPGGNDNAQNGQNAFDKKQLSNGSLIVGEAESITRNGVHTIPLITTSLPTIVQPPSPTILPIFGSESDLEGVASSNAGNISPDEPVEPGQNKRPRAIRFNSRVRITSGVGRSNKGAQKERSPPTESTDSGTTTVEPLRFPSNTGAVDVLQPPKRTDSTQSFASNASYTSSIMVPLRSSSELPPRPNSMRLPHKTRKPISAISDVLDTQDANAWLQSLADDRRRRKEKRRANVTSERTPLLRGTASHPVDDEERNLLEDNDEEVSDEEDLTNQSAWRYLSLYYWEARLSSLCCCDSEPED